MKNVLVVCGNGIASSSIMVAALNDWLTDQHLEAHVEKASLMDCTADRFNTYDLIVSSTAIDNPDVSVPIVIGIALLTGIGEDEVFDRIRSHLTA